MPRLPDIPIQSWLEDQQKRFHDATDGLFPALDFELGARSTESQIPPDYEAPGGMDQWKEAEQKLLEEQYRKQQQDAEVERQRQEQELAAQYAQQQQQAEAAQAQQQQERESGVMDQIRSLGIPTPSNAFASFQPQGDHTSTSGALDLPYDARQVDQGAHEVPPPTLTAPVSPVDQFNAHAQGLMTDAFGAPIPDPSTLPPPDHTSTTGLLDQIGSGVQSAASTANSALTRLGQGARAGADQLGTTIENSPLYTAAKPGLLLATGVADPIGAARNVSQAGDYLIENYGVGHQIKAFNEGTADIPGLVMGASGTMGGGGLAEEAITAIRALRAAGLVDEAVLVERGLAEKTSMTLAEIQKKTQGLVEQAAAPLAGEEPNPWPLTAEERALNAEADARAASQPAHGGYLEDASFGAEDPGVTVPSAPPESQLPRLAENATPSGPETARGMSPEEAIQQRLPGFEDIEPTRRVNNEGVRGFGTLPESITPGEPGAVSPAAESHLRSTLDAMYADQKPFTATQREQELAQRLQMDPDAVRTAVANAQNINPREAGTTQEALKQNVRALLVEWDQARPELDRVRQEILDHSQQFPGASVPDDLATEAAYRAAELSRVEADLRLGIKGQSLSAKAASQMMNAQKGGRLGAALLQVADVARDAATSAGKAAEVARKAIRGEPINESDLEALREIGNKLSGKSARRALSGASKIAGEVEDAARKTTGAGRGGGRGTGGTRVRRAVPPPKSETIAERMGRLLREQANLVETQAPEAELGRVGQDIQEVMQQARDELTTRMRGPATTTAPPVPTPEQLDQAISQTIGRRAVSKLRGEIVQEAGGPKNVGPQVSAEFQRAINQAVETHLRDTGKISGAIDAQTQRRIDGMLAQEQNAQTRTEVRVMAEKARLWADRVRRMPDQPGLVDEFDQVLQQMSDHSPVGQRVANDLRERLGVNLSEDSYRRAFTEHRQTQAAITEARLRAVQQQIKDVLNSPQAPDRSARIAGLYQDLTDISVQGFQKASQMQKNAHESGILKSGLFAKDADTGQLVSMMRAIDPRDPSTLKPILETMARPSLWAVWRELSFINMLSNPLTHLTNVTSTTANAVLKVGLRNWLEQVGSRGELSGTGAALQGLKSGAREGGKRLVETMSTGYNAKRLDDMLATGDLSHIRRELVPEVLSRVKLGKVGVLWHQMSTRPLEAADAMMGHMMYSSEVARLAQQKADSLIKSGAREVPGMLDATSKLAQREQVAKHVMDNIWDHPEIIKQAGKIEDYTLFRSKGSNKIEQGIRMALGVKNPRPNAGWQEKVAAGLTDFLMPFYNVPMNFMKQGLENTAQGALAPAGLLKAGVSSVRGQNAAAGEQVAKSVQGGLMMGLGTMLVLGDNLTSTGPSDSGDRRVWLEDHKINSWRWPGTTQWVSYEGTPWAIPFATIAGAKENLQYEQKAKPDMGPVESGMQLASGAAQGAIKGALSQTLVQAAARNFELITGQGAGSNALAQGLAGNVGRYFSPVPLGMMSFLAQLYDVAVGNPERDPGRAKDFGDIPEVTSNILESRIPGLRQQLPARLGAYGEETPQRIRVAGYMGPGNYENDPITKNLEALSVGIPDAPKELTINSRPMPITIQEQREFQRLEGQHFRQILVKYEGARDRHPAGYTADQYGRMRLAAREAAQRELLRTIPRVEMRQRILQAVVPAERR